MIDAKDIWTHRIARNDVPDEGLHVDIEASEAARAALARSAGLRNLSRLTASFDVIRKGREGLHVTGEVDADLIQDCVVTLEPVEQKLVEPVDLTFLPDHLGVPAGEAPGEASVSMGGGEPPEPLVGGTVDLGAIATEYFLLGIDPYPRKAGAVFEGSGPGDRPDNPFAALASLKRRKGSDDD